MSDLYTNHMVPGPLIRARLVSATGLDSSLVGDLGDLYTANLAGHPNQQAIYVAFGGEGEGSKSPGDGIGLDHVWHTWLLQRVDYSGWEDAYGVLRATMVCALEGWQPAADMSPMELIPSQSTVGDWPGLREDMISWRVAQISFV